MRAMGAMGAMAVWAKWKRAEGKWWRTSVTSTAAAAHSTTTREVLERAFETSAAAEGYATAS
jgi:hypothetical protein